MPRRRADHPRARPCSPVADVGHDRRRDDRCRRGDRRAPAATAGGRSRRRPAAPTLGAARPRAGSSAPSRSSAGCSSPSRCSCCSRSCSPPPTRCSPQLARSALDWQVDLDLGGVAERTVVVTVGRMDRRRAPRARSGAAPRAHPGGSADRTARARHHRPWAAAAIAWAQRASRHLARERRLGTVEAATILARRRRAVRGVRRAPARVPVRRARHDVDHRPHVRGVRPARLLRARRRRRPRGDARRRARPRGGPTRSRAQLAASLVLLGLTGVVLVSAFVRLRLYQDAYGWTELRFVVVVAIGWLAVALGRDGVAPARPVDPLDAPRPRDHGARHRRGHERRGPQAFVADRNLERALEPRARPAGRPDRASTRPTWRRSATRRCPRSSRPSHGLGPVIRPTWRAFLEGRRERAGLGPGAPGLAGVEPHPPAGSRRARGVVRNPLTAAAATRPSAADESRRHEVSCRPDPRPSRRSAPTAGSAGRPAGTPTAPRAPAARARAAPAATRSRTRSPPLTMVWPGPDERRERRVHVGCRVPGLRRLLDLDDLRAERRDERPVGDLVLELGTLALELLDLAADLRQLRLDLEQVA